jgi:hypothetical protein
MPWTFYNANGQRLSSRSSAIANLDINGGADIGEAIVDADLFVTYNDSGTANTKTAASRIVTYVGADTDTRSGVAKAWCRITAAGALEVPDYNIASVTDTSTGLRTIVIEDDFSTSVYVVVGSIAQNNNATWTVNYGTHAVGSVIVNVQLATTLTDRVHGQSFFGDQ